MHIHGKKCSRKVAQSHQELESSTWQWGGGSSKILALLHHDRATPYISHFILSPLKGKDLLHFLAGYLTSEIYLFLLYAANFKTKISCTHLDGNFNLKQKQNHFKNIKYKIGKL